jgi:hypothetical protein
LEDQTGVIEVNPENGQIDTIKILDEFRPGEVAGGMVSYGNFSLMLNSPINRSQSYTLGYHYRESILPLEREVLVVGEVSDETGKLKIGKPISGEKQFIISLKSNETLAQDIKRAEKNIFIAMIVCFSIAFCLLIISFIS